MLDSIVDILKLLAEGFAKSTGEIRVAAVHACMYFVFFVFIFVASFTIRTGSFVAGLTAAYQHSWLSPTQGYTQLHSQESLKKTVAADIVTTKVLNDVLALFPGAARVRMTLIHNGVTTITGVGILRFDITNGVARPGRSVGDLLTNLPLQEWAPDFTPQLLNGECKAQSIESLTNEARRVRLEALGVGFELGCPIIDVNGQIFGAIFVQWDKGDTIPDNKGLAEKVPQVKFYGKQIGAALDIQRLGD